MIRDHTLFQAPQSLVPRTASLRSRHRLSLAAVEAGPLLWPRYAVRAPRSETRVSREFGAAGGPQQSEPGDPPPPGASGNRRASTREQRAEGGVQASPKPSARSCMCTSVSCNANAAKPSGSDTPAAWWARTWGGVVRTMATNSAPHASSTLHQAGRTRVPFCVDEDHGSVRPLSGSTRRGTWVSSGGFCGPSCTAWYNKSLARCSTVSQQSHSSEPAYPPPLRGCVRRTLTAKPHGKLNVVRSNGRQD